jgi:hypothetical protein
VGRAEEEAADEDAAKQQTSRSRRRLPTFKLTFSSLRQVGLPLHAVSFLPGLVGLVAMHRQQRSDFPVLASPVQSASSTPAISPWSESTSNSSLVGSQADTSQTSTCISRVTSRTSPRFQPIRTSFGLWSDELADDLLMELPSTENAQTGALRCFSRGSPSETSSDGHDGLDEPRAQLLASAKEEKQRQRRAAVLEQHSLIFGSMPPGASVM